MKIPKDKDLLLFFIVTVVCSYITGLFTIAIIKFILGLVLKKG